MVHFDFCPNPQQYDSTVVVCLDLFVSSTPTKLSTYYYAYERMNGFVYSTKTYLNILSHIPNIMIYIL